MPPPHLGWDAVGNSIFGCYSWPLRNERQHRDSSHATQRALCMPAYPRGRCWGSLPGAASHKIPVCPYARCCMPLQLLRGFLRPSGDLLWDLPCFGKILCCFNCCVIWFKNVFSCPLVIFFSPFLPICALHNLQTKPITHKHMGKIGLSGAWGDECPVPRLQVGTIQTRTSPLQPVFKGRDEGCIITHSYMHCFINLTY